MDELEYRPQRAGRVLQSRRTGLIALAGYAPLNPWALDVITQVEEVADLHGMGVVILRYGTDGRSVDRAEELLRDGIADASVILFTQAFGSARLKRIGDLRLPTLAFGASAPHRFVDVLTQHEGAAVGEAVRHLVSIGCRRPAFISLPHAQRARDPRLTAFVRAATAAGIPTSQITTMRCPDDGYTSGLGAFPSATKLLSRPERTRPDAIMAGSDRGAITAMWAVIQLGLWIPDDVKIIGAGNIDEGLQVSPQLTTIGCEDVDYRPAIERLVSRILAPSLAPTSISMPWELIRRGTA
ncbi:MAG: LacI family DNA-binding transcriptional regulator [Propionibacteriaceae bacterium]